MSLTEARKQILTSSEIQKYKIYLSSAIGQLFPYLGTTNTKKATKYFDRQIPFCSFNVTNRDQQFLGDILLSALKQAADPFDPAFCSHACDKHPNFFHVIDTLSENISAGNFSLELSLEKADIYTKPKTRFLLTSSLFEFENQIVQPQAYFLDICSVAFDMIKPSMQIPKVCQYIQEKYSNFSTTKLVTAFLSTRPYHGSSITYPSLLLP